MANYQKTDLDETLEKIEEMYKGEDSIFSITATTFLPYIDSARLIMYSSHFLQRVVLNETEFPKVFTNSENMIGKYSSFDYRAPGKLVVTKIIPKFDGMDPSKGQPGLMFVYNEDKQEHDVIVRKDVENLTEKYGFMYDNSMIDSIGEGECINKGTSLYRPTSYDRYDNYGFGCNVTYMYSVEDSNIEDAIIISESLSKRMLSTEVELVKVSINDNDILLNLYGTDANYKAFPNIGEKVKNKTLCAKRRINNNHILYDLKRSNIKKVLSSDTISYIDGEIVDVNIFCNKTREEMIDAEFNEQILEYVDMNTRYYEKIRDYTNELLRSGAKCSHNIKIWNKRAKEMTDTDYKIKDEDGSVFSNIVMYFLVKRTVGISVGQKLTGRYGNKGVVSEIRPDYLMPHTETGKRIDLIFNTLGVFNRLNIMQLFEQSITFICNRVIEKLQTMGDDYEAMSELVFDIIKTFNEEQEQEFRSIYKRNCKTNATKREYFDSVIREGIYIHIPTFWIEKPLMDCLDQIYAKYDFIKPYHLFLYDDETDRYVKVLNPVVVGELYILKLRHSGAKGLSARSTGSINKKGVPEKTDRSKKHQDPYPKTPIRFGKQEVYNQMISMTAEDTAKEHLLYRSSVIGRKELAKSLLENFGSVKDVALDKTMTNRNVEILNAYLKTMGLELVFEEDRLDFTPDGKIKEHLYNNRIYLCDENEMRSIVSKDLVKRKVEDDDVLFMGNNNTFEEFLDRLSVKLEDRLEEYLYDESKDLRDLD